VRKHHTLRTHLSGMDDSSRSHAGEGFRMTAIRRIAALAVTVFAVACVDAQAAAPALFSVD
jgi:hypothetical protein